MELYFVFNSSASILINEIVFLHEAADYPTDLYNDIWWVRT